MSAFKLGLCPGAPDPMMMLVIRSVIIGEEFAGGSIDGMDVAAAGENRIDAGRGRAGIALVSKNWLITGRDFDDVVFAGEIDDGDFFDALLKLIGGGFVGGEIVHHKPGGFLRNVERDELAFLGGQIPVVAEEIVRKGE